MSATLEPARWPGGPPICSAANRPAFATEKAVGVFIDANCPHHTVYKIGVCKACGMWHFKGRAARKGS